MIQEALALFCSSKGGALQRLEGRVPFALEPQYHCNEMSSLAEGRVNGGVTA